MTTSRSLAESPDRLMDFIRQLHTQFFAEQENEFISLKALISQLRAKFFTQQALARRVSLDRTAIARYEDENRPEQPTFGYVACLFKLCVEELENKGVESKDLQTLLLAIVNQAIVDYHYLYREQKPIHTWRELCDVAEAFMTERQRVRRSGPPRGIDQPVRKVVIIDSQSIELPTRTELFTYVQAVQQTYARWADPPDDPQPPLRHQQEEGAHTPDAYIDTQARPLPMRVSPFRGRFEEPEEPPQDLVVALRDASRTVILGEPGSGKTTALERLAWVLATTTLMAHVHLKNSESALTVPIVARLADYQGEADLIPLVRRGLNRYGVLALNDSAVRLLLGNKELHIVLLLDGLNEFDRAYQERGPGAIRRHLDDYPYHVIHLTCRTADFDEHSQTPPHTQLWAVQPLIDDIHYWDDLQGYSDIRDYLRRHLGAQAGKRLYERLRADDRLHSLARLPLFLWMFKETGGEGELPLDRGSLLRRFVQAPGLLGRVPKTLRERAERSLEVLGWRMQEQGSLEIEVDPLYHELVAVRGPRSYELDRMCEKLQDTGLLVDRNEGRFGLLHQLVQEYAAAAYLARQADCAVRLTELAQSDWWRETAILTLWLRTDLHLPAYLQSLMTAPSVDLRVRVAAANVLAQIGDPRFVPQPVSIPESDAQSSRSMSKTIHVIEPHMMLIPAGDALLGSETSEGGDDERPQCIVPVAAFELAIYPVTNAEYACFIEAGGYVDETVWTPAGRAWLHGEGKVDQGAEQDYRLTHQLLRADAEGEIAKMKRSQAITDEIADRYRQMATWDEDRFVESEIRSVMEPRQSPTQWQDSRFNQANQPVVGVNWYEAMAYATWLSRVTSKNYRLPTEAEWEWAARRNRRRYPWGDEWDVRRCNSGESRLGQPSPVGIYPQGATPDGLHDLAGNVDEWTVSLDRPYPYQLGDGREDLEAEGQRVIRGGSWYFTHHRARCSYRDYHDPWDGPDLVGFRLARTRA